tara:strand:- start:122 stop:718 length:597 start_codon:yes stop_codon:yes gene_type:complete
MRFISDLPIVNNGIFVYDLDIKKDHSKYYKSLKYMACGDGASSEISIKRNVLNKLPEIKKEIKLACNHFINEILSMECDYHIYNSWTTLTGASCESGSHAHANSWISGVYYPEHNKNFNITFYNDYHNFYMTKVKQFGIYNSRTFTVNPKKNQLILFFSSLRHKIDKNNSNIDRYSLSFNILPKGDFGVEDSRVNFKF